MKATICIFILILTVLRLQAEDGHNLWFRNKSTGTVNVVCSRSSATLTIAREELQKGWSGKAGASIVLTIKHDKAITGDGFRLSLNGVQANTELGILYGAYEFLRRQQTGQPIGEEICNPSYEFRVLNHWDNLDGSIERGYAGSSIFWRKGESSFVITENDKVSWHEYARANASIGINGAVLNNVNASPLMLSKEYLERVKAIAGVRRKYSCPLYRWKHLPADTYCYFRCRKYRAGCQLVRLSLCTGKLVCFWPSGMEQPVEK